MQPPAPMQHSVQPLAPMQPPAVIQPPAKLNIASLFQLLQRMEERLAELEASQQLKSGAPQIMAGLSAAPQLQQALPSHVPSSVPSAIMIGPPAVISPIPSSPTTSQPNSYMLQAPTPKDPRDRIKRTEVPKYDGTKDTDNWLLDFTKYCRLTRLVEDEHILTAFSIAMTDKAGRWWEYAEKSLPLPQTWQTTKEAFLRKYANILKRDECVDKLRDLYQGSMAVADFFTEIEELNLYAQLDSESLPLLLKRGLNSDLRIALEISHSIKPIATYQDWKEKALYLGAQQEAGKKQKNKRPHQSNLNPNPNSNPNPNPPKPSATSVPKEVRDRRMKAGECVKCGQQGHIGRECRTGYVNDSGPAALTIADYPERQSKRRKQEFGYVNTLAARIEGYDSGPDNND